MTQGSGVRLGLYRAGQTGAEGLDKWMRDERSGETLLHRPDCARAVTHAQAEDHSICRPPPADRLRTPVAYAKMTFATGTDMPVPVARSVLGSGAIATISLAGVE